MSGKVVVDGEAALSVERCQSSRLPYQKAIILFEAVHADRRMTYNSRLDVFKVCTVVLSGNAFNTSIHSCSHPVIPVPIPSLIYFVLYSYSQLSGDQVII